MREQPWQQSLQSTCQQLAASLGNERHDAGDHCVWWGASHPEILQACRPALPGAVVVADADARALRRAMAAAGQQATALRLVDLHDLRLDTAGVESALSGLALKSIDAYQAMRDRLAQQAAAAPAVGDASASVVVMDMLLNRVPADGMDELLAEAFRVLPRHGQLMAVVLLADEPVAGMHSVRFGTDGIKAFLPSEGAVLGALERAGFHGLQWAFCADENPVVIDRIEGADVRLVLVKATKGKQGPCYELGQAVVYKGPWSQVADDDGHVYPRGARVAVCAKTYDLLMKPPYAGQFVGLRSVNEPALASAELFDCHTPALRPPAVTKGLAEFAGATAPSSACAPGSGCC